jgi:hypothetical protein
MTKMLRHKSPVISIRLRKWLIPNLHSNLNVIISVSDCRLHGTSGSKGNIQELFQNILWTKLQQQKQIEKIFSDPA